MSSPHEERLAELARRLLDGEAIDWDAAMAEDSEVVSGLRRLELVVASARHAPPASSALRHRSRQHRFIGDFRLVRTLGEGGMGIVYEAEQQHPRRPVALKVIRGGAHAGQDTLKLFQREAQTLARLRHPGIAQLYETGVTDEGLHYFAMELVRGETLGEWLKSRPEGPVGAAELKLRLALFRKICDAVAYAHQRGVIHRDLKPGNVLIPKRGMAGSVPDLVPDVKVLDFGLARMTESDVQMTTYVTEVGKVQGTLPYMSPEQVRGNPDEIDQRTDVYSLGVILYEMVTGRLPYDLSKAQLPEAVRIICEESPRSVGASFTGSRRLDADVMTIAGKALEKDPSRRYQSAAALAEDVDRWLSDQPILARPPSTAYQLRKMVRRHRLPFAFAGAVFVLVAALAVAMTIQAARIARERDRANQEAETARQVSEFLENLFKVADPSESRGSSITARELLDRGAERIDRELRDRPATQARLMRTIGQVYGSLGLARSAEALLTRALDRLKDDDLQRAAVLNSLGVLALARWDAEAALRLHDEANTLRARIPDVDPRALARGLWHLGSAQFVAGLPGAGDTLRRALSIAETAKPPDPELLGMILHEIGILCQQGGNHGEAVAYFRRAEGLLASVLPRENPSRISVENNLGWGLLLEGHLEAGRPWLESAVLNGERVLGADHPDFANSLHSLSELERRAGRLDVAERLGRRALRIHEARGAGEDVSVTEVLVTLGRIERQAGRLAEAEALVRRAVAILEREDGPESPRLHDPLRALAEVLRAGGRSEDAAQVEKREQAIPGGSGYHTVTISSGRAAQVEAGGR